MTVQCGFIRRLDKKTVEACIILPWSENIDPEVDFDPLYSYFGQRWYVRSDDFIVDMDNSGYAHLLEEPMYLIAYAENDDTLSTEVLDDISEDGWAVVSEGRLPQPRRS